MQFSSPLGTPLVSKESQPSDLFHFVLTNEFGNRLFASCMRFSQPRKASDGSGIIFARISFVVLSPFPAYIQQKNFLTYLHATYVLSLGEDEELHGVRNDGVEQMLRQYRLENGETDDGLCEAYSPSTCVRNNSSGDINNLNAVWNSLQLNASSATAASAGDSTAEGSSAVATAGGGSDVGGFVVVDPVVSSNPGEESTTTTTGASSTGGDNDDDHNSSASEEHQQQGFPIELIVRSALKTALVAPIGSLRWEMGGLCLRSSVAAGPERLPLRPLFLSLGFDNVVTLCSALLLEKKILLCSRNLALLTAVAEVMMFFLFQNLLFFFNRSALRFLFFWGGK